MNSCKFGSPNIFSFLLSTWRDMANSSKRRWAVALLFITPLLWSVNYLVGRLAPGLIALHMLALWRWTLACLVLWPCDWAALLAKRSSAFKNGWHYLVFGAVGMWISGIWV